MDAEAKERQQALVSARAEHLDLVEAVAGVERRRGRRSSLELLDHVGGVGRLGRRHGGVRDAQQHLRLVRVAAQVVGGDDRQAAPDHPAANYSNGDAVEEVPQQEERERVALQRQHLPRPHGRRGDVAWRSGGEEVAHDDDGRG